MKKILVVLLSLGLIVAFGATASALDVKFSGSYYLYGVYDNNSTLQDNADLQVPRAVFYQQMRVQTDFLIADGLKVTTRFDALEKVWGQTNWNSMTSASEDKTNSRKQSPSATAGAADTGQNIQENFEFEQAYLTFMTQAGQFAVGYQTADVWGTWFGNSTSSRPRIVYSTKVGPLTLMGIYEKISESDTAAYLGGGMTTASGKWEDSDSYAIAGIYSGKGIEAGLLFKNYADFRYKQVAGAQYSSILYLVSPYVKATFGPVYFEGEVNYFFGKAAKFDVPGAQDVDMAAWSAYGLAKVNIGPAFVGFTAGWVQGDGDDPTKITNNQIQGGGYDWKPLLYLNNIEINTLMAGTTNGIGRATKDTYRTDPKGYILYALIGGVNVGPKLLIEGALGMQKYDKDRAWAMGAARNVAQPAALVSKDIATELDIKATYKIYDNLTYMVGAGYIWTGDAWKANAAAKVGNDYLLLNKLMVTF